MPDTFERQLAIGRKSEDAIFRWLLARRRSVLQTYEIEHGDGKGPRLIAPSKAYVIPDMLSFSAGRANWIEAKHKTHWTFHGKTKRFVTGIDTRHYNDYTEVEVITGLPVFLLFFQKSAEARPNDVERWRAPKTAPVGAGLFCGRLDELRDRINHTHAGSYAAPPMTYWAGESLRRLASVEEVEAA